jgi:RNA polymerase sigma factor (sigma-70 family)
VAESVHELTSAVASGDTEAFARLYRAWFDFALAEAHRCSGRDEQFCLDAVQNAMLRIIRRIQPLTTEAALAAWLKACVRSACLDLLRSDARRARRDTATASVHRIVGASPRVPSAEDQERLAWLREQLSAVDADTARALDLRYRVGWTLARVAQAMGLRTGAVDGRINRTLSRLRAAAQEDWHE